MENDELFIRKGINYFDKDNSTYIHPNLFQRLTFPDEYPALVQIHMEHPALNVPLHWHHGPELIYSRNKNITVTVDGRKVRIKPGEFVLISSMSIHSVEPSQDDVHQDVMSVTFRAGVLEKVMPEIKLTAISENAPDAGPAARARMLELLEGLRCHVDVNKGHFQTNAYLFAILELVYTNFVIPDQKTNPGHLEKRNRMISVLAYIREHHRENLTTQTVAEHFGYTRTYFCRLFSQYGDKTFKQYLMDLRMQDVIQELLSTDRSVGTIAMEHGFPDEKSFFREFKRQYNMTPRQYRRQAETPQS